MMMMMMMSMVTIHVTIICLVISLTHSAPADSLTDVVSTATSASSDYDSNVTQELNVDVSSVIAEPSKQKSTGTKDTETILSRVTKVLSGSHSDITRDNENNIPSVPALSDFNSAIMKVNETSISSVTKVTSGFRSDITKDDESNISGVSTALSDFSSDVTKDNKTNVSGLSVLSDFNSDITKDNETTITNAHTALSDFNSDIMKDNETDTSNVTTAPPDFHPDITKGNETNVSSVTLAPSNVRSGVTKGNDTKISNATTSLSDTLTTKPENSNNGNKLGSLLQQISMLHTYQVSSLQTKTSALRTSKRKDPQKSENTSLRPSAIWKSFSTLKLNTKVKTLEHNWLRNQRSESNTSTRLGTIPRDANGLKDTNATTRLFAQLSKDIKTDNNTTIEPRNLKHGSSTKDDKVTTTPLVQPSEEINTDDDTIKQSEQTSSESKSTPSLNTNISQKTVSLFTVQSTTGPWSSTSKTDDVCPPETKTFANVTTEEVTWAFNESFCEQEYNWLFHIPVGYACIVEFYHVEMEYSDTLYVIILAHASEIVLRKFTKFHNESLAPLSMSGGTLNIKADFPLDEWNSERSSNFNVSFTVVLEKTLPPISFVLDNEQRESHFKYLCTGITSLPAAITCDGIRHCEHGEDEEDCAYSEAGCGDWFPYNNHCLKAKFINKQILSCGHSTVTRPLHAEQICRTEHNATLAILPDPTGIQLAANMIRKSGFLNAVVGIRKVKPVYMKTKHLYRFMWQWGDRGGPIAYEEQKLQRSGVKEDCALLTISPNTYLKSVHCDTPVRSPHGFICMRPNPSRPVQIHKPHNASFRRTSALPDQFPIKVCPDGSVVQTFHRCQWGELDKDTGMGWSPGNLPLFQCRFGPPIHYALLCDGKDDCADGSDETVCQKPRYSFLLSSSFFCTHLQAVGIKQQCNGMPDCFDNSDEEYCLTCYRSYICPGVGCVPSYYAKFISDCPTISPSWKFFSTGFQTGMVKLDGYGLSVLEFVKDQCPEGFYQCSNGLCIPGFLMNNGEKDCFHGEDEGIPAHNITCPGYYRCHGVGSCVHKDYVCDGIYHCPDKDDEMFCHMTCPQGCVCEGQAFTCSNMIDPVQHLHVRYLDLSHAVNVSLENIHAMEYLFFLNLSFCRLGNITLADMPQLQTLDLSYNSLTELTSLHLHKLPGLLFLDLSHNCLGRTMTNVFSTLSKTAELENLRTLILVNINLEDIAHRVFSPLAKLKHLDLRNNPLHTYDQESLWGLQALEILYTDQSKLCCNYFHPSLRRCYAPVDELSSCDDLLAQNFFRVFLWIFSFLAMAGNCGVFTYRLFTDKRESNPSSPILLKNLCASDFLMGVYMVIIGVADAQFKGNYVAREAEWTRSVTCTIAGFLSFVSSEVSAFLICVITVDRVLVICFPFHYQYHLGSRVTIFVCCMLWIIGITLAALPLLAGMEFYGLNSICLPLPITRKHYSGQMYAFSIFIFLNFVIFLSIGIGQTLIYHAIHNARMASGNQRHKDMTIARRLFIIVFTDFCCWFPVGVMGLLAFHGTPIPGQLNVWTAIFVLPLNSALNPFLYTLNGLLEEWKKRRMERRAQIMLGKLQTDIAKWQPSSVEQLIKVCVQSKKVDNDKVMRYLGVSVQPTHPSSLVQCTSCSEPDAIGSSAHLNNMCRGSELSTGGTQTACHETTQQQ